MEPQILKKIESLPFLMQKEVHDFVDFLLSKKKKEAKKKKPKFGSAKGLIIISKDFNEPLEDFKDYQ